MDPRARAAELFQEAYEAQMRGDLREAVRLYERSLEAQPTAEAHTFLGWTWSFLGDLDRAIECCRRAIECDPTFGNPYNDIGAYLIERGALDEAIPWLERAKRAPATRRPSTRASTWAACTSRRRCSRPRCASSRRPRRCGPATSPRCARSRPSGCA